MKRRSSSAGSLLDDAARRDAARWRAIAERLEARRADRARSRRRQAHRRACWRSSASPKRTHAGLRITDDATLDVVVAVLGGTVNKLLVAELTALGVRAAGISGADAATLVAELHPPIDGVDLGHVGRVIGVESGADPRHADARHPAGRLVDRDRDRAARC